MNRERFVCKTEKESVEINYYISNGKKSKNEDYFEAIRNHWSVEVSNHVRDVTFKEDDLKTKQKPVSKMFASLRTLTIKLLGFIKPKNMVAQLELFSDKFQVLLYWLREINFI
ncbi:MAG: putative transposase YbfD/YdcC [Saprospiraceae bacterium]